MQPGEDDSEEDEGDEEDGDEEGIDEDDDDEEASDHNFWPLCEVVTASLVNKNDQISIKEFREVYEPFGTELIYSISILSLIYIT